MSNVPIFPCSNDPTFKCSNVPMIKCSSVFFFFIGSQEFIVHWSIKPLVHWTIGPLVHWSIGPLVHWSIRPLHYLLRPFKRGQPRFANFAPHFALMRHLFTRSNWIRTIMYHCTTRRDWSIFVWIQVLIDCLLAPWTNCNFCFTFLRIGLFNESWIGS